MVRLKPKKTESLIDYLNNANRYTNKITSFFTRLWNFFSFCIRINYKYMYQGSIIIRLLVNILFVLDSVLLYFIILKSLNNGIVHPYFLLMILLGFVIMEYGFKKIKFTFRLKK